MKVTRRKFLAGSLAGIGALGAGASGMRFASRATAQSQGARVRYVNSSCAICTNKCVFRGQVVNGVIKRLEPEPDFPKARGMMCARGIAGAWTPYDPDRLKEPLIRVGERGEGKWRKASWEEAYQYIADKTNKIVEEEGGNRSCIGFAGSEGTYQEHYWHQFREAFGSTNSLRHTSICLSSNIRGFTSVIGGFPQGDVKNTRFMILSGANRAEAIATPDTMDMYNRPPGSCKIICIDPRFTKSAARADKWLPIKPGTDMALALAMMNVILGEGLQNQEYIDKYCTGFEPLIDHVKPYTPEWAERETDISANDIRELAREFATTPNALWFPGRRSTFQGQNETQTRRAIAILNIIIGAFDTPGGMLLNAPAAGMKPYTYRRIWYDVHTPRLESDDVVFLNARDGSWVAWRERVIKGEPYKVRGLFVNKQNVLETVPDRKRTMEMFDKLDIIVCMDTMMSDTAWYSDVVLPVSNYLERLDPPFNLGGLTSYIVIRQPLIDRMYNSKTTYEIVSELAAYFKDDDERTIDRNFVGTVEDHFRDAVSEIPGGYQQLKEKAFIIGNTPEYGKFLSGERELNTPSRKIELFSEDFQNRGLDPLPVYTSPAPIPPGRFRFIVGRHAIHTHSMTSAFPDLNWHMPENAVWINTKAAESLGIKNGDTVKMVNRTGGEAIIKAEVTEGIRPDCVYFAHGYGSVSPHKPLVFNKGASQATITESHYEPIAGNALLHDTIVEIRRI